MARLLPEVCQIQYGFPFDSARFTTSDGIPLIRIRDVVRGYSETYTTEECDASYIVNDGDMLIGMDGEFNIARWKGGKAYLNQRVCRLIPKADICPEYLFHFLPGALKRIEDQTPFATVKHLSAKQLNAISVPLPPLDEQRHIAKKLEATDTLISLRKQQIAKLDELVKARFVEMFGDPVSNPKGWQRKPLAFCLESIENGKSFVCESNAREGNWPAVLKLSAATYGDYRPEENKAVLEEKHLVESAVVRAGDLLFTRKNTPEVVGMCAYVYATPPQLMMPDLIFRLNTNDNCNKVYLWKLINHDLFRECISSISTGSAKSMSNISKERLMALEIILPPLDLQQQFAAFVAQTNQQKLTIQHSLAKLELLKKALMQKYFG